MHERCSHRFLSFLSLHHISIQRWRKRQRPPFKTCTSSASFRRSGFKPQISCTATKAPMHKKSFCFCVSHSPENCSKLLTSKKGKTCLFVWDWTIPTKLQLFPRVEKDTYWFHYKISDESSEKLFNLEFWGRSWKFCKRKVFKAGAGHGKSTSQPDQIWQIIRTWSSFASSTR